jgi:hypothetical protein
MALEKRHREVNARLRGMKAKTLQRGASEDPALRRQLAGNLRILERLLENQPSYYRLHEVFYTLGLTHLALESPYRAYRAFGKALAEKPAMDLAQPVTRLRNSARQHWIRTLSHWIAWLVFGVMLGTLTLVWLRGRPWRWLRLRHCMIGFVVMLAWSLLFWAAQRGVGGEDAGRLINNDGVYPTPVFVHTDFGTPGSEVVNYLFLYGLVAVGGAFFFAVATGRVINRRRGAMVNAAFAVLFSASLGALYYLEYCDGKGRFYAKAEKRFGIADGYLAYPMSDPEPYLLVAPLIYRGLDLSAIDDPVLIEWLKSYVNIPGTE